MNAYLTWKSPKGVVTSFCLLISTTVHPYRPLLVLVHVVSAPDRNQFNPSTDHFQYHMYGDLYILITYMLRTLYMLITLYMLSMSISDTCYNLPTLSSPPGTKHPRPSPGYKAKVG